MDIGSFRAFLETGVGIDVAPDLVLGDALEIMSRAGTSFLIVVENEELLGLVSEDDVLSHATQHGGLRSTPVSHVMRCNVDWVQAINLRKAATGRTPKT